jgi:hypothetical protein
MNFSIAFVRRFNASDARHDTFVFTVTGPKTIRHIGHPLMPEPERSKLLQEAQVASSIVGEGADNSVIPALE